MTPLEERKTDSIVINERLGTIVETRGKTRIIRKIFTADERLQDISPDHKSAAPPLTKEEEEFFLKPVIDTQKEYTYDPTVDLKPGEKKPWEIKENLYVTKKPEGRIDMNKFGSDGAGLRDTGSYDDEYQELTGRNKKRKVAKGPRKPRKKKNPEFYFDGPTPAHLNELIDMFENREVKSHIKYLETMSKAEQAKAPDYVLHPEIPILNVEQLEEAQAAADTL